MEILILISLMFVSLSQPMVMVMVLFMATLMYSLEIYICLCSMWYGMVMMLVMLSGILVIFTYMASMTPNEKFEMNFIPIFMLGLIWGAPMLNDWINNLSFESLKLWEMSIMVVNLFMVSYLLMIMLVAIWVSEWYSGPVQVNYWK